MTVFNFVFKRYFSKLSNIIFLSIIPIGAVFLPVGDWLPIPLGFQYYGILLLLIAARLSSIVMEDRANKVLLRIGVAPITHFQYLWQNLLAYSVILQGVNILVIIVGVLVHGEGLISPILLLLMYSIFSTTAIGFSLAWYSLFRNKETAFSVLSGVIILMSMFGGIMWPIEIMPAFFQRIGMLLPTYWLMEGILQIVAGGTTSEIVLPIVMMLMFSISFLILGSRRRIT